MGFIFDSIKDGVPSSSMECSSCASKAVAGVEDSEGNTLTNRKENGSETVVQGTDNKGEQVVVMSGPISNLYTEALKLKYRRYEPNHELERDRPVAINTEVGNESASMDSLFKAALMKRNSNNNEINSNVLSKIYVGKQHLNRGVEVLINPTSVLNQLHNGFGETEFLFVKGDEFNPDEKVPFKYNMADLKKLNVPEVKVKRFQVVVELE